MVKKYKQAEIWSSVSLILFALAVLWNQSTGNLYGTEIAWGGVIIGIIGIWRALVK